MGAKVPDAFDAYLNDELSPEYLTYLEADEWLRAFVEAHRGPVTLSDAEEYHNRWCALYAAQKDAGIIAGLPPEDARVALDPTLSLDRESAPGTAWGLLRGAEAPSRGREPEVAPPPFFGPSRRDDSYPDHPDNRAGFGR